jgi:hypothetical protein
MFMNKHAVGNIVATTVAVLAAAVTMFISVRFLRRPESALDWAVMLFAGLVAGIFVFFLVWGHFQGTGKAPLPRGETPSAGKAPAK